MARILWQSPGIENFSMEKLETGDHTIERISITGAQRNIIYYHAGCFEELDQFIWHDNTGRLSILYSERHFLFERINQQPSV